MKSAKQLLYVYNTLLSVDKEPQERHCRGESTKEIVVVVDWQEVPVPWVCVGDCVLHVYWQVVARHHCVVEVIELV